MSEDGELIPENLRRPASSSTASSPLQRTIADYNTIKEIGEGSFSTVYHAREMFETRRDVAIKMCLKQQILRQKRIDAIMREKNILARLSTKENIHPFIVGLYCTIQDTDHLYFVLTYASEGDLATILKKLPNRRFDEAQARFYTAELVEALDHIHSLGVIHRDVKPDNILIQASGHILLSDFGSAKELSAIKEAPAENPPDDRPKRRASFVGTAQFVTPEMLKGQPVDETCDYWAVGVSLFQFLTGHHCFHDESEYLIFQRIQKLLYKFPEDFPENARNLVVDLLVLEPNGRLGSSERGGIADLKSHPFFEALDWKNLTSSEPPKLNLKKR